MKNNKTPLKTNKFLLGATRDNNIIFGEYELRKLGNGNIEFSANFDAVTPFNADDLEDARVYYENLLDCYDKEIKYDMCERYNCAPLELAKHLETENGGSPQDIRDCSVFPEIIKTSDETEWYFENCCSGQHDTREEISHYTNKDGYNILMHLWDNYHLNALHAGTEKQEEYLKKFDTHDYKEQCELLSNANLLVDNGYKYGHAWLYRELPVDIDEQILEIEKLFDGYSVKTDLTNVNNWIAEFIDSYM